MPLGQGQGGKSSLNFGKESEGKSGKIRGRGVDELQSGFISGREVGRERPDTNVLLAYVEHPYSGRCADWIIHNAPWRHTTGNEMNSKWRLLRTSLYEDSACSWSVYFYVIMEGDDFKTVLEGAVQFSLPRKPACQTERSPWSFADCLRKVKFIPCFYSMHFIDYQKFCSFETSSF